MEQDEAESSAEQRAEHSKGQSEEQRARRSRPICAFHIYKYIYIYILERIARQRRASGAPGDPADPARRGPGGPGRGGQAIGSGEGPGGNRYRGRHSKRSPGGAGAQYINRYILALTCPLNGQIVKWIGSVRGIDQYSTDQVT